MTEQTPIGWLGIVRLGLVQASLGAVVVVATSTMNRVMVVELALPAIIPGVLVSLHYLIQILRPCLGYGSDLGNRRTPWIIGGITVLAIGGVGAAGSVALMTSHTVPGIALAVVAYSLIGLGVGSAGTSLLVLLAKRVVAERRAAAATIVWLMMLVGFAITAGTTGVLLDPYSPERLVEVTSGVAAIAMLVTVLAVWGVEGRADEASATPVASAESGGFFRALREVWDEPKARRFAIFVFVSMLAYSAQELVLEPFGGAVFGMSPGQTAKLTGMQHGGVLVGMLVVALAGSFAGSWRAASLKVWTVGGCAGSAAVLAILAFSGFLAPDWPLAPTIFVLGIFNGAFAVAAIGSMMGLAGQGRASREGVRMGIWGAAQAVAFGLGGIVATTASDLARHLLASPNAAYAAVFALEAGLFLWAARQAHAVYRGQNDNTETNYPMPRSGSVIGSS